MGMGAGGGCGDGEGKLVRDAGSRVHGEAPGAAWHPRVAGVSVLGHGGVGGMGVLSELGIIAAAFPVCAILVLLIWDHMGAEGTRGSLEGQIPAPHLWAPWPASAVPLLTVRL